MIKLTAKAGLIAFALTCSISGQALAQATSSQPLTVTTQADPAANQIRAFYDVLLETMKDAKTLGLTGRFNKLTPAVDVAFDFPTMTKMTIGPDWEHISRSDQSALIAAFRRMTIADYAHNFDGYNGESFTVSPEVQERAGDKIVSTKMISPGKAPIPFIYRMDKTADGWKIVDIYLNGYISEVATRRADFASTLKNGGATALAQKLDALTDKILGKQ